MSDHTVVSGSAQNAQHGIDCASCGNANPFGMRFCLTCGRPALYSQMTEKKVGPCPLCGCADPLNQAFCIACGTALVGEGSAASDAKKKRAATGTNTVISSAAGAASTDKTHATTVKHKTGFSWEPPAGEKAKAPRELSTKPIKRAPATKKDHSMMLASAAGLAIGAVAALALSTTAPVKYAFERLHWPANGLVVYARPPKAKVVLENVDTKVVTLAQTDDEGSLKIAAAQPGHYRLFLKAQDDDGSFTDVTIVPNRPTVVGYPSPISLDSAGH